METAEERQPPLLFRSDHLPLKSAKFVLFPLHARTSGRETSCQDHFRGFEGSATKCNHSQLDLKNIL